ncbi:MAG: AlpA family phage regulatory protein [Burkholderiales bacterium]|jgi:prophage regulatory protein|nr:AlpA family phage regulatory protein [Burkholderiales bacterium]
MNSQKTSSTELNQLLRINDLTALTTLSKSCIKLWVAQGKFPPPIALSNTVKVWKASDISQWLTSLETDAGGVA